MKKIGTAELGSGIPAVCVPVMGCTAEELEQSCAAAKAVPHDVIELRADSLADELFLSGAADGLADDRLVNGTADRMAECWTAVRVLELARRFLPEENLLFTFRSAREGGLKEIDEDRYFTMLKDATRSGLTDAVDVEFCHDGERTAELIAMASEKRVFTILSSHDFQKTLPFDQLVERLTAMTELGADAVKLACMPMTREDVFALMAATARMKERFPEQLFITMAMGELGVISRIAGEADGSCLTFGSAGKASAPGQIEAGKLCEMLRTYHRTINKY